MSIGSNIGVDYLLNPFLIDQLYKLCRRHIYMFFINITYKLIPTSSILMLVFKCGSISVQRVLKRKTLMNKENNGVSGI